MILRLAALAWVMVEALSPRWACAEPAASATSRLAQHLLESPQLVDDPGGVRSRLDDYGVNLQLFYNYHFGMKLRGGVTRDNAFRHSGSYDLLSRVDFEELASLRGLELLLHVKGTHGFNVNPDVGALADPIDDADGDFPILVAQLYAEQSLLRDRARIRLGYIDQQTILDRNAYANNEDRQFMSTALDNNPLVPLRVGLGATLFAKPVPWLVLTIGTADADNAPRKTGFDTFFDGGDSLMAYAEAGFRVMLPGSGGLLPGTYRLGGFLDSTRRVVFGSIDPATGEPRSERGSGGVYCSFDQLVHREGAGSDEGLGLFARFGWVDPDVNRATLFWSLGLEYAGLLPGRSQDALGLGMYQLRGSQSYRDAIDTEFGAETGVELYYRSALLPWLEVTPDFQFIGNPGGRESTPGAVVVALRVRVTF